MMIYNSRIRSDGHNDIFNFDVLLMSVVNILQIKATEVLNNGSTGPQTSLVTIKVTLTDINDNDPAFNQSQFVGYVPETAVNFTVIAVDIRVSIPA